MLITDFFQERLDRLQKFDLEDFEVSKTLLIDAIAKRECIRTLLWHFALWNRGCSLSWCSKQSAESYICDEGLEGIHRLKVWKGGYLEGADVCGNADYLIAERRAYLEAPFVCVIKAKRDDFRQGAAQCLVEMKACQWTNQQLGKLIDVYGIVTNGEGWKFYRLATADEVSESLMSGTEQMPILLGQLRAFFKLCAANVD